VPSLVSSRILAAAIVVLMSQSAHAEDWFDCQVNHSFLLDHGGFLEEERVSAFMRQNYPAVVEKSFSFDRDSGRYVDRTINWQFSIVQKGDAENSMMALRLVEGPATKVLQTLQIKTYSKNEFIYVFGAEVSAGYCAQRSNDRK
jgi:hypothetical protein